MDAEMQRGLLPGAVALSGKFVPVLQSVSQRTVATVREFLADPGAVSERVQDKLAATGNALREHVTADAHSATAAPSNTAGGAMTLLMCCCAGRGMQRSIGSSGCQITASNMWCFHI